MIDKKIDKYIELIEDGKKIEANEYLKKLIEPHLKKIIEILILIGYKTKEYEFK